MNIPYPMPNDVPQGRPDEPEDAPKQCHECGKSLPYVEEWDYEDDGEGLVFYTICSCGQMNTVHTYGHR